MSLRTITLLVCWLASVALAYYLGGYSRGTEVPNASVAADQPVIEQQSEFQPIPARELTQQDILAQLLLGKRLFAAIDQLKQMIAAEPSNIELRFKLAELLSDTGQPRAAIAELLAIRSLSLESDDLQQARQTMDELIAATNSEFEDSNNTAAAINFFSDLQALEPSHDRHRWHLVQWYLAAGEEQKAQRLFDETGVVGISQEEWDQVAQQLERHATRLAVRRKGGAMFADVHITTAHNVGTLNMLLDTGATVSAISLDKLRELGARRTPHMVNVQTANGMIQLPIYRVDQLDAGPLSLTDVAVVALTDALSQADGLLGLDVLDQLPTPIMPEN
ncbi:MAG: tetratricopeptide repeat protein [Pseudomonadales bacterium]